MKLGQVQAGADSARGDNAATLKGEIICWITANGEHIDPPLSQRDKRGRGLSHHLTGGLLCPVDYDWSDSRSVLRLAYGEVGHSPNVVLWFYGIDK